MNGLWSQHVSPWRGEDRGWKLRNALNKQASKASGNEPEPSKYVPSGVDKLYGPECRLSSGPACAKLEIAQLDGLFHLPVGNA
ncbi:hypothetical protein CRG98_017716 [Punica granatum]|uniref:Uncharacterized protein n=1 Tax=Punica granatum TaxID=22663 RepID=A0A2I0JZZ9_PUNGR|nr:hypothetical protein CRG98_017716 [Punica granatum]